MCRLAARENAMVSRVVPLKSATYLRHVPWLANTEKMPAFFKKIYHHLGRALLGVGTLHDRGTVT
jgi:hypothetical protein